MLSQLTQLTQLQVLIFCAKIISPSFLRGIPYLASLRQLHLYNIYYLFTCTNRPIDPPAAILAGGNYLTQLHLGWNQLSQLSTKVSQLPQSPILNLDHNPLHNPSTEFGKLRNYHQQMETMAHELTQLIDTANAPIFEVNTDGLINEWNQQLVRITGYSKDGVVGKVGQNLIKLN